jgi:hypothetical protein
MQLTRKHLNYILCNLPDPTLVERGIKSPYLVVPVHEPNHLIQDALLPNMNGKNVIKQLKFRYSEREQDWVLEDLHI